MSKIIKESNLREFTFISLVKILILNNIQLNFNFQYNNDSGHGKDSIRVETKEGENSRYELVEQALEPAGECVLANGRKGRADSIHNIKLELLRLNTERITITLDCCRTVTRETRDATVDLQ